jgi:hypothetical protein
MTPEKFIRRVREILPGAQKASLNDLLNRVATLQELENWTLDIHFDDNSHESSEGQPDSVSGREPAEVWPDSERDPMLLPGDDREPAGICEQA